MAEAGEDGAAAGEAGFHDFSIAENCAAAALEEIFDSCAQQLYASYIEKRAFPYAAERVVDNLMSELRLCFVRHDRGEDPKARFPEEDPEDWELEPEPATSTIDSWARSCVPVRKRYVQGSAAQPTNRKTLRGGAAAGKPLGFGGKGPSSSPDSDGRTPGGRGQLIPLVDERDEDQEEAWMREMKEKEAKRKREDELRIKRKAQEEAEEEEKLKKVKGEMANKPTAYDTEGNIIWVQPLDAGKLPNPNPALSYKFKQGAGTAPHPPNEDGTGRSGLRSGGAAAAKRRPSRGGKKGKKEEFTDSFQRLSSQQPPIMDSMQVSAGVVLGERGRTKKSDKVEEGKKTMTRKDYQGMVAAERAGQATTAEHTEGGAGGLGMTVESSMPDPMNLNLGAAAGGGQLEHSAEAARVPSKPVSGVEQTGGLGVLEADASSPRGAGGGFAPQRPSAPPPAVHNPRARREAIGYRRGERDRMPTSGAPSAGFRNYFPPPPVGATMGHGLLPKSPGERGKEFFFPDWDLADEIEAADEMSAVSGGGVKQQRILEVDSPRALKMGGNIQAPNRELVKRLLR